MKYFHWLFHDWSNWSAIYSREMLRGGWRDFQKRSCKICGKIEERNI